MNFKQNNNLSIWAAIITSTLIAQPARANVMPEQQQEMSPRQTSEHRSGNLPESQTVITDVPHLNQVEFAPRQVKALFSDILQQPTSNSAQFIAQDDGEITVVTGIQLNETETGVDIVIETLTGETPQTLTSSEGNEVITDVLNAELRLPDDDRFQAENPAEGIALITATQLDSTTVRITVTGTNAPPVAQVIGSALGLTIGLSLESPSETGLLPEDEEEIEIVVTATRTEEAVEDVPRSVTIITREQIETQTANDSFNSLNDILGKLVPGFGPPKFTNRRTRGQNLRGRRALILIDGVVQNTNFTNNQELNVIDPSAIERIEVVRGPIATYGSGSTGGIINIITREPTEEKFETTVGLGVNSDAVSFASGSFGQNLQFGISGDEGNVDFRVDFAYDQTNALFDADGDRIPAEDIDNSRSLNGLAKVGIDFDENQRLEATYNIYDSRFDPEVIADPSIVLESDPGKVRALDADLDYENQPGQTNHVASLVYTNNKIFADSKLNVQLFFQRTDFDRNVQDFRPLAIDAIDNFIEDFRPVITATVTAGVTNQITNQVETAVGPLLGSLPPFPPFVPPQTPVDLNMFLPPGGIPGLPPGVSLPTVTVGDLADPAGVTATISDSLVDQVAPTLVPGLVDSAITALTPDITTLPLVIQGNIEETKWGVRSQVETPLTETASLLWGLDYTNERNSSEDSIIDQSGLNADGTEGIAIPIDTFTTAPQFTLNNIGVFAQGQWEVTEQVILSGGLRYEYINADIESFTASPLLSLSDLILGNSPPEIEGGTNTASDVVFNLGVVIKATEELSTFINFAQGFAIPSLGFISGASTGFDVTSDELLEPEKVNNYEIGLRGDFDNVQFTISAFYNHSDEGQNLVLSPGDDDTPAGLTILQRSPQRNWGVEATVDWQPHDNWALGSTFTWNEGDADFPGDNQGFVPLSSIEVPPIKWTFYVANQTLPGWTNRLQLLFVGDRDRAFDEDIDALPIDSYTTLDFLSSVNVGPGQLQLGIENLLNNQFLPLESQTEFGVTAFRRLAASGRRISLRYIATF